jgi:alkylresorcinol/alkylpyrone synthase
MAYGRPDSPVPRLLGLATAVPPFALHQSDILSHARKIFSGRDRDGLERLLPAYSNAGIEIHYSCVPLEWYEAAHGLGEKNRLYIENAVTLLEEAALKCLSRCDLDINDVDAVVSVSTTGIATPSLDALLAERLGMRRDVQRLPVFGLGCAGGVLGLARAAAFARSSPGTNILFLVAELCGLTFRQSDQSKSNVIASVLFGDGAAAAMINCGTSGGPALAAWGEHTWPDSLEVMGWRVEDNGFGVLFSRDIPTIIRNDWRAALDRFLDDAGLPFADIDQFLCHPGGAKVIDALEDVLDLPRGGLTLSRAVLREYGNMSAATVLFILERALAATNGGRYLLSAVGPGFSAGFLTVTTP